MPKPSTSFLKSITPFNTLTDKEIEEVAAHLEYAIYTPNTYVFRQGDPSQNVLFIIEEGLAEVMVSGDHVTETIVSYRKAGDFFGETSLIVGQEYSGSVRAVEELRCWLLPKEIFEQLLYKPAFSHFFTRIITERMRSLYDEIGREQAQSAYLVEAGTFRRRIKEIMSTPVMTCSPEDTVEDIAEKMVKANVSSLVMVNEAQEPIGLVTERHLVTRVLASKRTARLTKAVEIADPVSSSLSPDAFFYQALLTMVRHRVKHLTVVSEQKLAGIVTISDLIKTRSVGTISILQDIEDRHTIPELASAVAPLNNVLKALMAEKTPVREITAIMNEYYDRLTRKIISIAERELADEGFGSPPADYCFINMGSGGRREQSLRTDLDNAIIFAEPEGLTREEARAYFLALGRRVIDGLVLCGFKRCNGDVMASNPAWCRSLTEWMETVQDWFQNPSSINIRHLTIFLDFRPLAGQAELAERLRNWIFDLFVQSPLASHLLAADELQYRQPLSLTGRFITRKDGPHKGEINLKISACVRVVDCVRLFALRHRIEETSTWDRLDRLATLHILKKDDVEFFGAAYETLMFFRLRENLRKVIMGKEADNYINPDHLTKMERSLLKDAFIAIGKLQKITNNHFSIFWLAR
ncbi:MAG TPA: CBS domain-containing protein [Clostridia bacterium]|nr:CBS domain-containing protein [Clostridia bacterium]